MSRKHSLFTPYPKQVPKRIFTGTTSANKRLFALLCSCGWSKPEAYRIAVSDIKSSSAAVAGCNLSKDREVQWAAYRLARAFHAGEWELNTDIINLDIIDAG